MPGDHQPFDIPQALTERLDIRFALGAAGLGVWELDPLTNLLNWDDRCRNMFGLAHDNPLTFEQVIHYVHPDDVDAVNQAVKWAMNPNSGGSYDCTFRTLGADDGVLRWVRFIGQSYFNDAGEVYRFAGVAQDVTKDIQRKHRAEPADRFRMLIEETPVATCLYVGRQLTIEVANKAMIAVWGKGPSVIGKPLAEALPELRGDEMIPLLDELLTNGMTYEAKAGRTDLVVNGVLGTYYFDYSFRPLRDTDGAIYAIMETAVDVTQEVNAHQQLQDSEARFRSIVEQAPMAIGVLRGRNLVIEVGNKRIFDLWGKDYTILGLPILEALPELKEQKFIPLLEGVYKTGQPYVGTSVPAQLVRQGQWETLYFDFVYTPFRDAAGDITGVMVLAIDVTAQVLTQQAMEEASNNLRGAIELAQLGTWEMDLTTGLIEYSGRLREWHGLTAHEVITRERAYRFVRPADGERVRASMAQAIKAGGNGFYDVEYCIEAHGDSQERILHAQGKAYFNEQGEAYKITGTVQDVTQQRQVQLALEQQVQQRTEALAAANEKLLATNEELAGANAEHTAIIDELARSNQLVTRSNRNLEQFAYIASHDLQEPLRKVQQFGDLLLTQYAAELGSGTDYLVRMKSAASRMSTLIKDLLSFSRISTNQEGYELISLEEVLASVLSDLEVAIHEVGAVVEVQPLPTLFGSRSQIGQLFQNLLGNALKFRRPATAPVIKIRAELVAINQLPPSVRPMQEAPFYQRIDVADNGIGFDEKYVDRIFQVFQRLHGKSEYAGTGIGLAICEKVAINHGGAITATSQPGQGATFSVYLPI
ncbi:MAG: Phytochrome-like protein cph1 [Spirosoma sp.]|nr:Phytochrome-like protein cph1 [Spirosoma sp.]